MLAKRFNLTIDFDAWLEKFSHREAIEASRVILQWDVVPPLCTSPDDYIDAQTALWDVFVRHPEDLEALLWHEAGTAIQCSSVPRLPDLDDEQVEPAIDLLPPADRWIFSEVIGHESLHLTLIPALNVRTTLHEVAIARVPGSRTGMRRSFQSTVDFEMVFSDLDRTFAAEAWSRDQDRILMPGAVSADAYIATLERFQSMLVNTAGAESLILILAYEDLRGLLEEHTPRDLKIQDVLRSVLPRLPARQRRFFERACEHELMGEAAEPILEGVRSAATRVQLNGVECALSLTED